MEWIPLILQLTLGFALIAYARLVALVEQTAEITFALGAALLILGALHALRIFYERSRGLSEKDRTQTVGSIEKKAEKRKRARAQAGYLTFLIASYLLVLLCLTLWLLPEIQQIADVKQLLTPVIAFGGGLYLILYRLSYARMEK